MVALPAIGTMDELTGQAVYAFVTLKPYVLNRSVDFELMSVCNHRDFCVADPNNLNKELVLQVRKSIGPFAQPKKIIIVPDLPKTRSGKVCHSLYALHDLTAFVDDIHHADHASHHAQNFGW